MLIYLIFIFIIKNLLSFVDIKSTFYILNTIFNYQKINIFFISILIGILIKNIIINRNNLKNLFKNKKYLFLIYILIIKNMLITYNLITITIGLIISIILKKFKINRKILYIFYVLFPIYINDELLIIDTLINIIKIFNIQIINSSLINLLYSFILLSVSYFTYDNKKRNVIITFLLLIYLIYYIIL